MAKAATLKADKSSAPLRRMVADDRDTSAVEVKTMVKPVANAIAILRYLGATGGPYTATHIAKALGINTSTCFNILRTLVGEGVVDFDRVGKTYAIGFGLTKLIKVAPQNTHIQEARPLVHELAERYDLTICLWQRIGDRITSVLVEQTAADLRIHLRLGQRLPALLGSSGRVLAPHMQLTRRELRSKFSQLRWARPLTFEHYWEEALQAQKRGYAVDDGHYSAGVLTISTPVFDPAADVEYTLTGLTFRGRMDEAAQERFGQDLMALSKRLTAIIY